MPGPAETMQFPVGPDMSKLIGKAYDAWGRRNRVFPTMKSDDPRIDL